jgi:MFS family permease
MTWVRSVLEKPEWPIVVLLVVSAIFSAACFYQATKFAEVSTDLLNQARFAEAQEAQWRGALQAEIIQDRRVLLGCVTAIQTRDAALKEYSRSFDPSVIETFVNDEQTRIALQALLIADSRGDCEGYSVSSALQVASLSGQERFGSGDPEDLLQRGQGHSDGETRAVLAAVLFAAVFLLLTFADAAKSRFWLLVWLASAMALAASGLITIGLAFIAAQENPLALTALMIVIAMGLGLAVWIVAPRPLISAPADQSRGWPVHITLRRLHSALPRHSAGWWSAVLGSATLVVFAMVALGYTQSTSRERESVAAADRLTLQARQAVDLSEQSGLSVLAFTAQLAELDARFAGSAQSPAGVEMGDLAAGISPAHQAARDELLHKTWPAERDAWQELLQSQRGEDGANASTSPCLSDDLVLPWRDVSAGDPDDLPADLLLEIRDDPNVLGRLIDQSSTASATCATAAALSWDAARDWGGRASRFTVALVVLGLAGFIFGLVADPDRTKHPKRWLLASGLLGLAAGVILGVIAWVSSPTLISPQNLGIAARAYAESATAALTGDCESARVNAEVSATVLSSFGPAHVAQANAAACSGDAWLISPAMTPSDLSDFHAALGRARDLGMEDSGTIGNLGWAYLLMGVTQGPDSKPDGASLRTGLRLTEEALETDRANPFFCFNLAFGTLANGDGAGAQDLYAAAVKNLTKGDGDYPPCDRVVFDEPFLQNYIKLAALADLELLEGDADVDSVRELIVASQPAAAGADSATATDMHLGFFPQEIGLITDDGSPLAGEPVSIVWYYRPSDLDPWAVLYQPSISTIDPGDHLDRWWSIDRVAPAGEYRADVYSGGQLARRLSAVDSDWWTVEGLRSDDFRWVQAPDLGITAIIPRDWVLITGSTRPGVEVVYGGETGHVAFKRADGTPRDNMEERADAWSGVWLDNWGIALPETGITDLDPDNGWYLEFDERIVDQSTAGLWIGVGHRQYLVAGDTGLLLDPADPTCPGTTVMTLVQSDDAAVADTIWWSQSLQALPAQATIESIRLASPFVSPQFSLEFPEGWVAAGCPGKFSASAPDQAANVIVDAESAPASLAAYVDEAVAAYGDHETFPDFELLSRRSLDLTAGMRGEEIEFTWTSQELDVFQRQLYTTAGTSVYLFTFTTTQDRAGSYDAEWSTLVSSFQPTVANVIPASCGSCNAEQLAERQANLDRLASRLAAVDPRSCNDTTDTFDEDALVRVGCTFPGGFLADFALWPDRVSLDSFEGRFTSISGAVVLDWRLFGESAVPTGSTVEWVKDGDARFFWTWDELLVTGNALLEGGDQERLNGWWQTSGALLQE